MVLSFWISSPFAAIPNATDYAAAEHTYLEQYHICQWQRETARNVADTMSTWLKCPWRHCESEHQRRLSKGSSAYDAIGQDSQVSQVSVRPKCSIGRAWTDWCRTPRQHGSTEGEFRPRKISSYFNEFLATSNWIWARMKIKVQKHVANQRWMENDRGVWKTINNECAESIY